VQSTLVRVELPRGEVAVPDLRGVERAREADLGRPMNYQAAFVRNGRGQVVLDRARNTAELLAVYYPRVGADALTRMVSWDVDDPNALRLRLPDGGSVDTRVTRRSLAAPEPRKLETSEFVRQVRPPSLQWLHRPRPHTALHVQPQLATKRCPALHCCALDHTHVTAAAVPWYSGNTVTPAGARARVPPSPPRVLSPMCR
jgi:hypothetical protein